jgi:hypothetical protein
VKYLILIDTVCIGARAPDVASNTWARLPKNRQTAEGTDASAPGRPSESMRRPRLDQTLLQFHLRGCVRLGNPSDVNEALVPVSVSFLP